MKNAMKLALEAFRKIARINWHDGLKGLDKPTDFAERQAAMFALGDAKTYALRAIKDLEALEEALAKQEQKYRRGDRLVCLETDEFCVIHISGVDRQWVKFPDSHIGVYTNEQIADMFELLAKEQEQKRPQNCGTSYCSCIECVMDEQEQRSDSEHLGEPVAWIEGETIYWHEDGGLNDWIRKNGQPLYTTPQQRKPLTDEQIGMAFRKVFPIGGVIFTNGATEFARAIEAAHGIKE